MSGGHDPGHPAGPPPGQTATLVLAGVAGLAALATGLAWPGAVLLLLALGGLLGAAVGRAARRTAQVGDIVVPRGGGPDTQALAAESRRIAAALADPDQLETALRPRLLALAQDRLARQGLSLHDAPVRERLGEPGWLWLTGARPRKAMRREEFARVLAGVEGLGSAAPPEPGRP